jgi:hypothetical protein
MQPIGMIGLNSQHLPVTILRLGEQAGLVALHSALQKFQRARVCQHLLTVGSWPSLIPFHFINLLKRRTGKHLRAEFRRGQQQSRSVEPPAGGDATLRSRRGTRRRMWRWRRVAWWRCVAWWRRVARRWHIAWRWHVSGRRQIAGRRRWIIREAPAAPRPRMPSRRARRAGGQRQNRRQQRKNQHDPTGDHVVPSADKPVQRND